MDGRIDTMSVVQQLKANGLCDIKEKVYRIKIAHAKYRIEQGLEFVCNGKWDWLPDYDAVAEWLSDTEGKGLLLMGTPGVGKTVIARYILPVLINHFCGLVVNCCDATDLASEPDRWMRYKLLMVDDVGTEGETVVFGQRRQAFAELVDAAEKQGKLLILTTNLNAGELKAKYGERVVDRLHALTKGIAIRGKSHRK